MEENCVCLCIDFAVGVASSKCIEVVIDVVVLVRGGLCELHSLGWVTASGLTPVSHQSST